VKDKKQGTKAVKAKAYKTYYPAFIDLEDKKTVVVGGGKVAERKILGLLDTGATVTVVSPWITKRIEREKQKGRICHICRGYRKSDLKGAFLVIAATDDRDVNEKVSRNAPCLVNVVDVPKLCNFIVPSTMQRGALTIAVSTGGVSPALARSLRKELEKNYGCEFSAYLKSLQKIRAQAMTIIKDGKKRAGFLKAVASENMLKLLKEKGCSEAGEAVKSLFNSYMDNNRGRRAEKPF
jgi:precorrin-2 dehydrogenase / sirohydrochlorin ferrochelatase